MTRQDWKDLAARFRALPSLVAPKYRITTPSQAEKKLVLDAEKKSLFVAVISLEKTEVFEDVRHAVLELADGTVVTR